MKWGLALKGMAMGIAEAIPGVSGGTIAFITNIYQELLRTIQSITPSNIALLFKDRQLFWKAINGNFLLWLMIGMVAGLIGGILVIGHLLEHHQILLWAFFFGLVLASAIYLGKDVKWSITGGILAIAGAILTYIIAQLTPADGSDNLLYIFFAGCLAVSALMLPGLSGSFVLLLLGLYDQTISALKSIVAERTLTDIVPLFVLGCGILTGLFSFARIMNYLFSRFPQRTMATMIGVLVGSLTKLWPWKLIETAFDKEQGMVVSIQNTVLPDNERFKIVRETNLLPGSFTEYQDNRLLEVLLCFAIGFILVLALSKLSENRSKERT